jgi:hypothetical protein
MAKKPKRSSLKKFLANRCNSKRSTGPTSPYGNWRSLLIPILYPLSARTAKSNKELLELAQMIISLLRPCTPAQEFKVALIIQRVWQMTRYNQMMGP